MIKSNTVKETYTTLFEKDKDYFFRKDDGGRNFFHYYCKYKSGCNFVRDIRQFIRFGVDLKLEDSEGKGPIFYIIENEDQNMAKRILNFMIMENLIEIDSKMLPDLIYHCTIFDRSELLKFIILDWFELSDLYHRLTRYKVGSNKTLLSLTIQSCLELPELCMRNSGYSVLIFELHRHLKLFLIQILLGDSSENTIFSILDKYGLSNNAFYSKFNIDYWDCVKKLYFFSDFKMNDYKTKYGLSQSQISAINGVEIIEKINIQEYTDERWSENGTVFKKTVKGGIFNGKEVELRTFTVLIASGVPNIYEEIANYSLGKIPPYGIIGYYYHGDCFTLILEKICMAA